MLVELHNDSTLRYFPRPLPIEDFFARQIRVRLDAHEVPAPSVEDHLVLICVHGAKPFWERLTLIADVAGLVARQTSISWERAGSSAEAVKAEHLLHTGLRLAVDVLRAELPEQIVARVREDAVASKLAVRVLHWLPAAGYARLGLFERATFRLRMRGNFLAAPAYLLRLSFSPTEEDWQAAAQFVATLYSTPCVGPSAWHENTGAMVRPDRPTEFLLEGIDNTVSAGVRSFLFVISAVEGHRWSD